MKPIVDYVVYVHIKDVIGRKAITLGKGEINIKECLRTLKKNGYEGVLFFETEGEDSFEENEKYLKKV